VEIEEEKKLNENKSIEWTKPIQLYSIENLVQKDERKVERRNMR